MPDGEVMIPDLFRWVCKAKLKDNYLEIFKDVVSADTAAAGELDESEEDPDEEAPGNTEVLALPAGPKVLLLMPYVLPGTKFVIPKDDTKNYTKVVQFLREIKLLGHRGSRDAFKKLTVDQKDLVKKYLGVELLLTETDALVRETLLRKLTL
jgi:hypothetical protein